MLLRILWKLSLLTLIVLLIPQVRDYFFNVLGWRWLYIFLFGAAISSASTPLIRQIALRLGIVDKPGGRKAHERTTALLGGLAIVLGFTASLLANMILTKEIVALLWAGGVIAVVSLIDDWKGLSAKSKLLVHVGLVVYLMTQGIILDLFPTYTLWGQALNVVFTMLWIIGITNAMNFIDGMDGLAAGISAIISLFLALIAFQTYQPILGWIALAMLGSCLGFLPYNFRQGKPATIFLGDTGSIFLGFTLAALAVIGDWATNNPIVSFSAPVLIFWVLIYDMTYITVERFWSGKVKTFREWLDYVGRDHLHHRTADLLGNNKRRSVLFIYLLAITLGLSAIALRNARPIDGILLVIQAFLVTVIVTILDYWGRRRDP